MKKYHICRSAETPEEIEELNQLNELFLTEMKPITKIAVDVEYEQVIIYRNEDDTYTVLANGDCWSANEVAECFARRGIDLQGIMESQTEEN